MSVGQSAGTRLLEFVAVVVVTVLVATLSANATAATRPRPNIVILLADDLTWSDIGAYGADHVATPNIDRLAAEGMRFSHAFTATAMCAPTRQQLYTGLFPVRSGAYPNHAVVDPGTRSMVHALVELGYRVGLSGKTHFGPQDSFPFEMVGNLLAADGGPNDVDLRAAEAFMQRDAAQPFALVLAFNESHEPWTKGDPGRFDVGTLHVPPYLVDTPETRELLTRYYAEIEHLDSQVGGVLDFLDAAELADDTMVLFTSEQGAAFPFAKWTLYDAGVRTAFLVRWPGWIAAGSVADAMVQYVDVLPTLTDAAGGEAPAGLDGRSFLPVLFGRSSSHRDVVFGIHTNRGIIHGVDYPIRSIRTRRFKLIWNLEPSRSYSNIRTAVPGRDAGFRSWLTRGAAGDERARKRAAAYLDRPKYELYDLQRDPHELENLAGQPTLQARRKHLAATLERWMAAQGDLGVVTERAATGHMNPEVVARIRESPQRPESRDAVIVARTLSRAKLVKVFLRRDTAPLRYRSDGRFGRR